MANIELVIKIPEEKYNQIINFYQGSNVRPKDYEIAIINGTLLPKRHKRLIEDNFEVGPVFDEEGNRVGYKYITQEDLNNTLTIIEADKAEWSDKE